jgi:UDP-N-acetylglucosamine 2-epimerase (non-hydrolysing)
MKAAPLVRSFGRVRDLDTVLVHTGQHHDVAMSERFFTDLALPRPALSLGVHGGDHADQTARLLLALETALAELRPDLVLVVGDVNSTLAASLVAAKLHLPLGHVEAGLRSGDLTMPEEVNRIVTDALSEILYTPTEHAGEILHAEGHADASIRFVGNIMIDSLRVAFPAMLATDVLLRHGLTSGRYIVLTVHRPSNVDVSADLMALLAAVAESACDLPVIFPVHPRTRRVLETHDAPVPRGVRLLPPVGYLEFVRLLHDARLVLTDSGGVQEETTVLGVPCLTLRDTTERPITVTHGTNRLIGSVPDRVAAEIRRALASSWVPVERALWPPAPAPALWDGRTAERISADLAARWTLTLDADTPDRDPQSATSMPPAWSAD